MMGDTSSREISALWVFLMEHQDMSDCTLIVFCFHKNMLWCMKKKRHKDAMTSMIIRHIHWWAMNHNVMIEYCCKPLY